MEFWILLFQVQGFICIYGAIYACTYVCIFIYTNKKVMRHEFLVFKTYCVLKKKWGVTIGKTCHHLWTSPKCSKDNIAQILRWCTMKRSCKHIYFTEKLLAAFKTSSKEKIQIKKNASSKHIFLKVIFLLCHHVFVCSWV